MFYSWQKHLINYIYGILYIKKIPSLGFLCFSLSPIASNNSWHIYLLHTNSTFSGWCHQLTTKTWHSIITVELKSVLILDTCLIDALVLQSKHSAIAAWPTGLDRHLNTWQWMCLIFTQKSSAFILYIYVEHSL
jgi:hypothetical protein